MAMGKLKPNLYIQPLDVSNVTKSKFAGYCPDCAMALATLDKTGSSFTCPRCSVKVSKPSQEKKRNTSWL